MGHRVIDDSEEGDGEKRELEGDPGDIFARNFLEAVEGQLMRET